MNAFMLIPALFALLVTAVLVVLIAMSFRTVVKTNEVHIVQSRTRTVSYGKDQAAGNCYYAWPAWIPRIGIRVISLPVSVFDVQLNDYAAYDKGRVPFVVDILAFFRIEDSNIAAQRVSSFTELSTQLRGILQGASRSILAQSEIEEILGERAKYGLEFTKATNEQLKAWGVVNVKNVELMDIRDSKDSQVIANIMAKKKSLIEMESRMAVAKNIQSAKTAEIDATQVVAVKQQEADQLVGQRTAEKTKNIGIADQQAQQAIKDEEKTTAEKTMAVKQVNEVKAAEIARGVQVVQADQDKQTMVIRADGEKMKTVTIAEGTLGAAKLHAEAVTVEGIAKGEAEKAVLMAPVSAQVTLAKEIGTNPGYQTYLIAIKQIDANQVVGVEQAKSIGHADIKVIANTGAVTDGITDVMGLISPKGGLQIGAMLESLKNTDAGKAVLSAVSGGKSDTKKVAS